MGTDTRCNPAPTTASPVTSVLPAEPWDPTPSQGSPTEKNGTRSNAAFAGLLHASASGLSFLLAWMSCSLLGQGISLSAFPEGPKLHSSNSQKAKIISVPPLLVSLHLVLRGRWPSSHLPPTSNLYSVLISAAWGQPGDKTDATV